MFCNYHTCKNLCNFFAALLSLFLISALPTRASNTVSLAWDQNPETDIAGYRLKHGTSTGTYTDTLDVGPTTTATVGNLSAGTEYFFIITAYNTVGLESSPSAEVSYLPPNDPPSVNLTNPTSEETFTAPASFNLSATASDSDGSVSRVDFYSGATMIDTATSSPYSVTWKNVPAGTYTLSAIAVDNEGATAFSEGVTVTVNAADTPTSTGSGTLTWLPDGSIEFTVTDAVGQTDTVYVSNDMSTWTLFSTMVNETGTLIVTDPEAATADRRFYRVSTSAGTEDTVGFIKLRIAGTTGSQSPAYSYLGLSLTNPTSYTGTITTWDGPSITQPQAPWSDDQFNGANGEFFLEITSGPNAGFMTDILATDGATKTLTLDDDLSALLQGGEAFRIRGHRTIADVFGPNNEAGLNGASTVSGADEIRVLNPVTQEYLTFYFQTEGTGGIGWRSSTDSVTDASQTRLYADQGVIVCRKIAGDRTLRLTGTVKTGPTIVPLGSDMNLVANMYPAGTLSLGNSNLYLGKSSLGLEGAKSISKADEVRIFDGTSFKKYFFKTGGRGGSGWRDADDDFTDVSSTPIPVGASVYVVRKGRPAFDWTIPEPF